MTYSTRRLVSQPLIIYTYSAGRFGNQLLRFFHWAAWVRELDYQCSILHLPFWPYAKLFSEWSAKPACVYPDNREWVNSLAHMVDRCPGADPWDLNWKLQRAALRGSRHLRSLGVDVLRLSGVEKMNLEDSAFIERARATRFRVCAGWEFGCWSWLERHAAEVRRLFQPLPVYRRVAEAFVQELRAKYDVVLGLLARRGDYSTFFNGRLYYSWADYAGWVRQAMELYPGRRVVVVISSDDPIPLEAFAGLPVVLATGSVNSQGHWLESFLELSLCDLILGPPSTFVACAAFYGDKPWWPLRSAGQALRTDQVLSNHLFDAARDPELALSVR